MNDKNIKFSALYWIPIRVFSRSQHSLQKKLVMRNWNVGKLLLNGLDMADEFVPCWWEHRKVWVAVQWRQWPLTLWKKPLGSTYLVMMYDVSQSVSAAIKARSHSERRQIAHIERRRERFVTLHAVNFVIFRSAPYSHYQFFALECYQSGTNFNLEIVRTRCVNAKLETHVLYTRGAVLMSLNFRILKRTNLLARCSLQILSISHCTAPYCSPC